LPLLNIPDEDRIGLTLLRDMPEDLFASVLLELERSPDSTPSVAGIPDERARGLKESIDTMYTIRASADVKIDEFVNDVWDAFREPSSSSAEEQKLKERLTRVLTIDPLNVAAKAVLLHNESEHDFCEARILTDVRPVFGDDPEANPDALIITHTLKLSYHQTGSKLQEIYLTLGSSDLKELTKVIDRATKKADSIRRALTPTKLRLIDPQKGGMR
jgi:hypothetical protein